MYCHLSLSINDESFPPAEGTPALGTRWTEFREADTFSQSPAALGCRLQPGQRSFQLPAIQDKEEEAWVMRTAFYQLGAMLFMQDFLHKNQ